MAEEKIVALFDTTEHGHAAIRELIAAGVSQSHVEGHDENTLAQRAMAKDGGRDSFWSRLFGGHAHEHERHVFDRTVATGGHVVTVRTEDEDAAKVIEILERHHPLDIDDHAAKLGLHHRPAEPTTGATTGSTTGATPPPVTPGPISSGPATTGATTTPSATADAGTTAAGVGTTATARPGEPVGPTGAGPKPASSRIRRYPYMHEGP